MQIGILRGDFSGFAAITGVYCKEQLAEYFGYLPAVDLVYNKYIFFQLGLFHSDF